jgi:hypothetical protein
MREMSRMYSKGSRVQRSRDLGSIVGEAPCESISLTQAMSAVNSLRS